MRRSRSQQTPSHPPSRRRCAASSATIQLQFLILINILKRIPSFFLKEINTVFCWNNNTMLGARIGHWKIFLCQRWLLLHRIANCRSPVLKRTIFVSTLDFKHWWAHENKKLCWFICYHGGGLLHDVILRHRPMQTSWVPLSSPLFRLDRNTQNCSTLHGVLSFTFKGPFFSMISR